ncbi:MAG: aldehyde ferredoxin oxidoreductase C-terminal domain-containing protein [Candidatus Bathyarchaeota archaeon]|nr:aldehyde ferredoxin oxidoreductase C-terminal domain-containing protein [Candidatus Bathyarchaeota archaeon]
MRKLGAEGNRATLEKPKYGFWMRQGTMATIEWSQENSVLPTFNFKEGVFEQAETIGGFAMEKIKESQKGCLHCNMLCGNVVQDSGERSSELDYESVAMLGSNVGLGDLKEVATLNRLADDYGIDTISLGNVMGFAMEASEKKLIDEKINWGDFVRARELVGNVVYRRGIGDIFAEGTRRAADRLGGHASKWAMNVKGLEVSAYDCHLAPGMALAYATAPIGAHHKDAWVISWEIQVGRQSYSEAKVDRVIELQRIRGGLFESLVTCRFPWIELGLSLEWYSKFLKAATGVNFEMEKLFRIADRFYNLIRAFWVREYQTEWSSVMDYPPYRWFDEPLTAGPCKGAILKRDGYERMLHGYYRKRGWDHRGIPTETTLNGIGLTEVAKELKRYVKLRSS